MASFAGEDLPPVPTRLPAAGNSSNGNRTRPVQAASEGFWPAATGGVPSLPVARERIRRLFQYSRPLSLGALVRLVPSAVDLLQAHQTHIQHRVLHRQQLSQLKQEQWPSHETATVSSSPANENPSLADGVAPRQPQDSGKASMGPTTRTQTTAAEEKKQRSSIDGGDGEDNLLLSRPHTSTEALLAIVSPLGGKSSFPVASSVVTAVTTSARGEQQKKDDMATQGNSWPATATAPLALRGAQDGGGVGTATERNGGQEEEEEQKSLNNERTTTLPPPGPALATSADAAISSSLSNEEISRRLSLLMQRFHPYQLCELLHEQAERLGYHTYQDPTSNDIITTAAALRAREEAARQYVDAALARLRAIPAMQVPQQQQQQDPGRPWSEEELMALDKHIMSVLGCKHGKERHCPHQSRKKGISEARQRRRRHREEERRAARHKTNDTPTRKSPHPQHRQEQQQVMPRRKISAEELAILLGAISATQPTLPFTPSLPPQQQRQKQRQQRHPNSSNSGGGGAGPTTTRAVHFHDEKQPIGWRRDVSNGNPTGSFLYGGGATVTLIKSSFPHNPPQQLGPQGGGPAEDPATTSLDALNGLEVIPPQPRRVREQRRRRRRRAVAAAQEGAEHAAGATAARGREKKLVPSSSSSSSSLSELGSLSASSDSSPLTTTSTGTSLSDTDSLSGSDLPFPVKSSHRATRVDRGHFLSSDSRNKKERDNNKNNSSGGGGDGGDGGRGPGSHSGLLFDGSTKSDGHDGSNGSASTSSRGSSPLMGNAVLREGGQTHAPSPLPPSSSTVAAEMDPTAAYVDSLLDVKMAESTRRPFLYANREKNGRSGALMSAATLTATDSNTDGGGGNGILSTEHHIVVNTFVSPNPLLQGYTVTKPFTIHELSIDAAKHILALPRYAQPSQMNHEANTRGRSCYRDPLHGTLVLSSSFLSRFPHCFGEYCTHCPHGDICWRQNAMFSYTREPSSASSTLSSVSASSSLPGEGGSGKGNTRSQSPSTATSTLSSSTTLGSSSSSSTSTAVWGDLEPWPPVASTPLPHVNPSHAPNAAARATADPSNPLDLGAPSATHGPPGGDNEGSSFIAAGQPAAAVYYAGQWSVSNAGVVVNANSIEDILRWELKKPSPQRMARRQQRGNAHPRAAANSKTEGKMAAARGSSSSSSLSDKEGAGAAARGSAARQQQQPLRRLGEGSEGNGPHSLEHRIASLDKFSFLDFAEL